jgi:hypothetical protein
MRAMTKALYAISGTAAALLPRPFAGIGHLLAVIWRDFSHSYRPERHYMRGPGPAWRAKHGG